MQTRQLTVRGVGRGAGDEYDATLFGRKRANYPLVGSSSALLDDDFAIASARVGGSGGQTQNQGGHGNRMKDSIQVLAHLGRALVKVKLGTFNVPARAEVYCNWKKLRKINDLCNFPHLRRKL
jgi:hypothetical protein